MLKKGFTLIEILIVVAILAILTLASIVSLTKNRLKADDAKIKSDLSRLKIAFEDYYNDNNCYPPVAWFDSADDCDTNLMSPYLNQILCNKKTGLPYPYWSDVPTCPQSFILYADLSNLSDDSIMSLDTNISGVAYTFNYGVSSTDINLSQAIPNEGDGEVLGDGSNIYYCQSEGIGLDAGGEPNHGNCTSVQAGDTCTPSFSDANCGNSHFCVDTVSVCN